MCRLLVALSAVVLLAAAAPATASGAKRCGGLSGADGTVFHIRALGTICSTARTVARNWNRQQLDADTESPVTDAKNRVWKCRIVRRSTGTDAAASPYPNTKIHCTRNGMLIGFWLRS